MSDPGPVREEGHDTPGGHTQPNPNGALAKEQSFTQDFIVVSEFSEKEGPIPLFIIPEGAEGTFNLNTFVLKIMAVDFQNKTGADAGGIIKDSQVVIPEPGEQAHCYVHYFTLMDLAARGYVRPMAMSYITHDPNKIIDNFTEFLALFTKASEMLKTSNHKLFLRDIECKLADLKFTTETLDHPDADEILNVASGTAPTRDTLEEVTGEMQAIHAKLVQALDIGSSHTSRPSLGDVAGDAEDTFHDMQESFEGEHDDTVSSYTAQAILDASQSSDTEMDIAHRLSLSYSIDAGGATNTEDEEQEQEQEEEEDEGEGEGKEEGEGDEGEDNHDTAENEQVGAPKRGAGEQEDRDGSPSATDLDRANDDATPEADPEPAPSSPSSPPQGPVAPVLVGPPVVVCGEVYRPQVIRTLHKTLDKILRTVHDLCVGTADDALAFIRTLHTRFARQNLVLQLEGPDASILSPSSSLLSIGHTVLLNFNTQTERYACATDENLAHHLCTFPTAWIPGSNPASAHQSGIEDTSSEAPLGLSTSIKDRSRQGVSGGFLTPPDTTPGSSYDSVSDAPYLSSFSTSPLSATSHTSTAKRSEENHPDPERDPLHIHTHTLGHGSDETHAHRHRRAMDILCEDELPRHMHYGLDSFAHLIWEAHASGGAGKQVHTPHSSAHYGTPSHNAPSVPSTPGGPSSSSPLTLSQNVTALLLNSSSSSSFSSSSSTIINGTPGTKTPSGTPSPSPHSSQKSFTTHLLAHMNANPQAWYKGRGLLEYRMRHSWLKHVVYAILKGRPVVVMAHPTNEYHARALVTALSVFLPGGHTRTNSADPPMMVPWRTKPLRMADIACFKLIGLCKQGLLSKCVERYVTIVDFESDTVKGPAYPSSGRLIEDMLAPKRTWPDESSYLAYVHYVLFDLATKSCLYYHICCVGIPAPSQVFESPYATPASTPLMRAMSVPTPSEVVAESVGGSTSPSPLSLSPRMSPSPSPSMSPLSSPRLSTRSVTPTSGIRSSTSTLGSRTPSMSRTLSESSFEPPPAATREVSRASFFKMMDILPGDSEIVEHLCEVIKEQQALELCGAEGAFPTVRLDYSPVQIFKNSYRK